VTFSAKTLRACVGSPWLTLTPILAIALAFRFYDLDAITLILDEMHDVPVAVSHGHHFNPFDLPEALAREDRSQASQARLPYYLTAVSVALFGSPILAWAVSVAAVGLACVVFALAAPPPIGRWGALVPVGCAVLIVALLGWPRPAAGELVAARRAAALFGVAGVAASYALGRTLFGHWAGLFAAGTLAVSTMDIGMSRCAVTSGDSFVAAFFTIALCLLYRSVRRGSGRAMMGCAAACGLAIGSKLSAALLWPITVAYAIVVCVVPMPTRDGPVRDANLRRLRWATLLHGALLGPLALIFFFSALFGSPHPTARFALWLAALGVYVFGLIRLIDSPWTISQRHLPWFVFNVCAGGAVVAGFSTPYHLRIGPVTGMLQWWGEWAAMEGVIRTPLRDLLDIPKVLLVRAQIPVNLLALGGLIWACQRRLFDRGGLVLVTVGIYASAVALLTWKSLNYLMPLLPLVHVLAGGAVVAVLQFLSQRNVWGTVAAAAVVCASVIAHTAEAIRVHPHYVLDGHGSKRYLSFQGQLQPTVLHTQPLRPAVQWLAANAAPDAHVAVFFPVIFPTKLKQEVLGYALDVIHFEAQRSPRARAKQLTFDMIDTPQDLGPADYVLLLCCHPGYVRQHLRAFEQTLEVRQHGVPGAWVFQRRVPSRPATDPGASSAHRK